MCLAATSRRRINFFFRALEAAALQAALGEKGRRGGGEEREEGKEGGDGGRGRRGSYNVRIHVNRNMQIFMQ